MDLYQVIGHARSFGTVNYASFFVFFLSFSLLLEEPIDAMFKEFQRYKT